MLKKYFFLISFFKAVILKYLSYIPNSQVRSFVLPPLVLQRLRRPDALASSSFTPRFCVRMPRGSSNTCLCSCKLAVSIPRFHRVTF